MTQPGRNSPCPCGSGRKYKQCCQRAQDEENSLRLRLRGAEGVVVPALLAIAAESLGPEYVAEAWDEFLVWPDEPTSPEGSPEVGTTFDAFFVFSFVPDAAERELPEGWPSEPLALHVLRAEADAIQAFHREFIEQACRSPASFFVVESTLPGRAIDMQDIMTGRRFHVLEQAASRLLQPGHVTYARVLTLAGGSILLGASPWIIPASWRIPLIEMREHWRPRRRLTCDEVEEYSIELRETYHAIVDALHHPEPPRLTNTDGDPLEPTTLAYQLSMPAADAIDRLVPLATLRDEIHVSDEVVDAGGVAVSATLSWIKAGNRKQASWDNTILGTLLVDGSRLVVEVNSARRAKRIQREIRRRLGAGATLVDTTTQNIDEILAGAVAANTSAAPDELRSPELESLESEFRRRHMETWLDTKIPALANRTPRQAVTTARGRERLEAVLDEIAHSQRDGALAEVAELRRRLGLVR